MIQDPKLNTAFQKRYERVLKRASILDEVDLRYESKRQRDHRIKRFKSKDGAGYAAFFDYYLGYGNPSQQYATSKHAPFHLEAIKRLLKNDDIYDFRLWFRGAAKSTHSGIGNLLLLKEMKIAQFFLIVGATEELAQEKIMEIRNILEFNERYILDFGVQKTKHWTKSDFATQDGSRFLAKGVQQPMRGMRQGALRLDVVVFDDVELTEQAKANSEVIDKAVNIFWGEVQPAFGTRSHRVIIANNYCVKNGFVDKLRKSMIDRGMDRFHQDVVNIIDDDGKPTWPDRFPLHKILAEQRNTLEEVWQSEYMNNPMVVEGLFQEKHVLYSGYEYPIPTPNECERLAAYWDLSLKNDGDYKACALVGLKDGKYYVYEVFLRRCSLAYAVQWHYKTRDSYFLQDVHYNTFFDATGSQGITYMEFFRDGQKKAIYKSLPIEDKQTGKKETRIEATLLSLFTNKQIIFDVKLKNTDTMNTAIYQMTRFSTKRTSQQDDFLDALESAIRQAMIGITAEDLERGFHYVTDNHRQHAIL